jgi:hypothetical protein
MSNAVSFFPPLSRKIFETNKRERKSQNCYDMRIFPNLLGRVPDNSGSRNELYKLFREFNMF